MFCHFLSQPSKKMQHHQLIKSDVKKTSDIIVITTLIYTHYETLRSIIDLVYILRVKI
jgi:hypothetical protein